MVPAAIMEEDPIAKFGHSIGVETQALAWMYDIPFEVQSAVIDQFDASGSKDGNVMGRLQGYVRHLLRRNGQPVPESLGSAPPKDRSHAPQDRSDFGGSSAAAAAFAQGRQTQAIDAAGAYALLPEFSQRIGLTGAAEEFLHRLPQEVVARVVNGFDPGGTKDGNVWGRLLGYVRSLWARHWGVDQETSAYIRTLPEDTQLLVMMEFDPTGSKDGNVGARLAGFIRQCEQRGGGPPQGKSKGKSKAVPHSHATEVVDWGGHDYHAQSRPVGAAPVSAAERDAIVNFAQQVSLDNQALAFLQSLESEVVSVVIKNFNPSGTKDGNVWGRLLGYIRNVWCRQKGVEQAQMKTMPEQEQMLAMADPARASRGQQAQKVAPRGKGAAARGGGGGSVRQFSAQWGLNSHAESFVDALPAPVRDSVIAGFDASGTKDGNVWGRLLGFSRQKWVIWLGLDSTVTQQVKTLSEEAQMLCMTSFDPSSSKDGNIGARLQGFMKKCSSQCGGSVGSAAYGDTAGNGSTRAAPGKSRSSSLLSHDPQVMDFLERCGLDLSALDFLQHLPEDLLQDVMNKFDPSGTKDGNVLGRLEGYVKFLSKKRGLGADAGGGPPKRARG